MSTEKAKARLYTQSYLSDFREPKMAHLMANICAHIRKGSTREVIIKSLTEEGFSKEDCKNVIEMLAKRYFFHKRDYTGIEMYLDEGRYPVL